jgi:hypothetical protein
MRQTLAVAALLLAATTAPAQAQMFILGNAKGCFGLGCTPDETAALTLGGVTLEYTSAAIDFKALVPGGTFAISQAAGTGSFGQVSISESERLLTILRAPFTLSLGFINPITPNSMFTGFLKGFVIIHEYGGGILGFEPQSITSPYFDPAHGWGATLSVTPDPLAIDVGSSSYIEGHMNMVTPEPLTVLTLGSGLVGVAAAARRRRKQPPVTTEAA